MNRDKRGIQLIEQTSDLESVRLIFHKSSRRSHLKVGKTKVSCFLLFFLLQESKQTIWMLTSSLSSPIPAR